MLWVSQEEDTFDGIEGRSSKLRQGVGRSRGTLGVTLEDETMSRVGSQGRRDSVDDVTGTNSGDLGKTSRVDSVVYLSTRLGGQGVSIHCSET